MEPRTPRTIWRLTAVPVERAADLSMASPRPSRWPPRGPVVPPKMEPRVPRMELATEAPGWVLGGGNGFWAPLVGWGVGLPCPAWGDGEERVEG